MQKKDGKTYFSLIIDLLVYVIAWVAVKFGKSIVLEMEKNLQSKAK